MEKYDLKNKQVKFHNILFASTSEPDYEMYRIILLEKLEDIKYDEYVVVEGSHCSCYDFDDTEWEAIKYNRNELIKLAEAHKEHYRSSTNELYDYVLKNLR